MILSTLDESVQVESLHPAFKRVFDYVKSLDLAVMEDGKIELDGDALFISHATVSGVEKSSQLLEVHKKYIDIHILLEGLETIGWLPTERLKEIKTPYDCDKDIAFYTDIPQCYIDMVPGDFMIVYPTDGHAPIIGDGTIKKLIVKISV